MPDLTGKVAAVTGASSGIGAATARALAGAGAAVALGARREDRLKALAAEIETGGGKALALPGDLADETGARDFVEQTRARLGRLDILVNNAGVMLLGPVDGADPEDWRRMIDINLLGLLYCTHAALPLMREGGGGDVVNVSSVAGRVPRAGAAVYNLTKHGVTAFSEALRQEAVYANIRVICVEPGFVETELLAHNEKNPGVMEAAAKMRESIDKVLESEDIARAVLYAVTQPAHVSVNEVLVRPSQQRG